MDIRLKPFSSISMGHRSQKTDRGYSRLSVPLSQLKHGSASFICCNVSLNIQNIISDSDQTWQHSKYVFHLELLKRHETK